MLTVYDGKGNFYRLTERIGSGGEGTVYRLPNNAETVAKIYHEPPDDEKAEKLRWMAANADEYLLKVAAWITEVLLDKPNGKVVGFLMPSVQAKEIHELYSLKSRRVHFPRATWQFLIHAAANVARAFYALHKTGHVMGDVNHGNCVVSANGTVKLIDCDSYGINDGTRRYRCEVGVATHLAPELQGKNLGDIERLPAHDNFGLAVIIFQLLFLGRHPFAGTYEGTEDKSIEDCIRELRFAYSKYANQMQIRRPPGTLSLEAVGSRVAELFERAFLTENRPEPREWIEALEDLSNSLQQCNLHPGHHFYKDLISCPFCEIETKSGLMLFPFIGDEDSSEGNNFNVFTVENLLASFNKPQNLPALTNTKTAVLPPPSPYIETEKTHNKTRLAMFAVSEIFAVLLIGAFFGNCSAIFIGIFIAILLTTINNQSKNVLRGSLTFEKESAETELKKIEADQTNGEIFLYEKELEQAKLKIADYKRIQQLTQQKVKTLQEQVYRYHLGLYLEKYKIAENPALEIAPKKLEKLMLGGVRDASDVGGRLFRSLEAVDEKTKNNLWQWRKELEKDFRFDESLIPETEKKRVFADFAEKRRGIEREIELLLGKLRSGSLVVRQKQNDLRKNFDEATEKLCQIESDLKAVGTNAAATILLFTIPFAVTFVGGRIVADNNPAPYKQPKTYQNEAPPPPLQNPPPAENYTEQSDLPLQVSENITDGEIEKMSDAKKASIAYSLHNEAAELISEKKYRKAESKLRLAIRFISYAGLLNELGNLLYLQGNYKESQKVLFESLNKIDSKNVETKNFIGRNHIALKEYEQARDMFISVLDEFPNLYDANYNLALAYKGSKNYDSAIEYFRAASRIFPENAEVNYQLALCYKESGNKQGVREQYEILLNKDKITAEKLKREIGNKFWSNG